MLCDDEAASVGNENEKVDRGEEHWSLYVEEHFWKTETEQSEWEKWPRLLERRAQFFHHCPQFSFVLASPHREAFTDELTSSSSV